MALISETTISVDADNDGFLFFFLRAQFIVITKLIVTKKQNFPSNEDKCVIIIHIYVY